MLEYSLSKGFSHEQLGIIERAATLCDHLDFIHICAECKLLFLSKMWSLDNDVVTACFVSFLCYECDITDGKCSIDIINDKVFNSFYSIAIENT